MIIEESIGYVVVIDLPYGRYYKGAYSNSLRKAMHQVKPYSSLSSAENAYKRLRRIYVDGKSLPTPYGVYIVSIKVVARSLH